MQNRRKKHPQKVQIKIKEGQYKSIRWILILLFLQHFYYLTFTFCELGVFLFVFWVVFFAHASHCWSFSGKNSYYSRTFKNDNSLEGNLYINPNMNNNSEESEPQTQWVKAFLLRLIYVICFSVPHCLFAAQFVLQATGGKTLLRRRFFRYGGCSTLLKFRVLQIWFLNLLKISDFSLES